MNKYKLATLIFIACSADALAGDFDWIEGHWRNEHDGQVSEEIWTNGEGGIYLAVNRSIRKKKAHSFEFLRIVVTGDQSAYCAQPGGSEAVCFPAVEVGIAHAVFEKPDHDFPQRIHYVRDGDILTATISDLEGEQSVSFSWNRQ